MTPDSSASGGASFWVNLGRPGSVYLLAEALGKGGTYLLFIAIATFLSVEDFGLLNVLLALMTVLGALVAMGLPDGVVRFHFEDVPQQEVFTIAALGPLAATAGLAALVLPWRSNLALSERTAGLDPRRRDRSRTGRTQAGLAGSSPFTPGGTVLSTVSGPRTGPVLHSHHSLGSHRTEHRV
ncbi:MAG: oligosaccharide flippase family protein [Thermoanaerobaculia bacterium]|nr:oligosaccharide flippase family protein [Thermoanaerobaculia bacterium]